MIRPSDSHDIQPYNIDQGGGGYRQTKRRRAQEDDIDDIPLHEKVFAEAKLANELLRTVAWQVTCIKHLDDEKYEEFHRLVETTIPMWSGILKTQFAKAAVDRVGGEAQNEQFHGKQCLEIVKASDR